MKKPIIILISLLYSGLLFSQAIDIRGYVLDYYTHKEIRGVVFSYKPGEILDITSETGGFHIRPTLKFKKTVKLTHPDYYPVYIELEGRYRHKLQTFYMLSRKFELDTIFYNSSKENKQLVGEVFDGSNLLPLGNAIVKMPEGQRIAYSNMDGEILSVVPMNTTQISVSHPDYETKNVKLKQDRNRESFSVRLNPIKFKDEDTLWKSLEYQVSVAVNEFFIGAIGLQAQRFLGNRHAIGLHMSYYFHGSGYAYNSGNSDFQGIKIAPFYRFYTLRSKKKNFFLETKLIGGYFDFSGLFYSQPPDNKDGERFKISFSNIGFGAGMGFANLLKKSEHLLFSMTFGFQYFPMNVPSTMHSDNYGKVEVENNFWYLYGPGSYLELKLIFGVIF